MMTEQRPFTWEDENFLDDTSFSADDAKAFQAMLSDEGDDDAERGFAPGTLLKGTIVELSKDYAVIDVGLKSEGLVPIEEFVDPELLALGNDVEVLLEATEDDQGQIVLSRERARRQRQWENISQNCEEGSIVQGTVTRKVKGGLMVDIGMEAFLPGSQIDSKRIKNLDEFIGNTYELKILKINVERKNVVVSRREVVESERAAKRTELLENMEVGELRDGVVKNITDFGVFLDLDGIDGLLHITDMTWKRIKHPSEMVKIGDELEVVILSVDKEKGRVALGLKQKEANPWEEIEEKYPPGKVINGKITSLVPYGAFIEIEPGIEGLIHISEMSWTRNIADPSELVSKGDEVQAVVLAVQKEEGKISLGMKQIERNPWEDVEEKYPVGTKVQTKVRSLTNYGAFVELEPGVDALIHISDLSWTKKISHPSEILSQGDEVEAIVRSVDPESKKITLSVKQLTEDPWKSIARDLKPGTEIEGKITRIAAFGAFVDLGNDMEGLIHVTELSSEPFSKIEDVVNVGDVVKAHIVSVDPEQMKISCSLKQAGGSDDIVVDE